MIFGTRKVESLSYRMVKKIAEKFSRLSRVHQRHRQTGDRQQTTDGRLIAYSERNVVRSLKRISIEYNDRGELLMLADCPQQALC